MIEETLEARVARLERQMKALISGAADDSRPAADDWKQTVGMFRGDPIFGEMIEESQRMRNEDRRHGRDRMEPGEA